VRNNKHTEAPIQKKSEEVMDLNFIRNLVTLLSESNVDEIEIEEHGKKIRIAKGKNNSIASALVPQQFVVPQQVPTQSQTVSETKPTIAPTPSTTKEIRSPIVGTFYRSPAPDADSYVEIGTHVKVGSVLCIIEAMKLMNEIESDIEGKIVKILVENGKPVEFNQPLFLVEPA
jgi:acetyl-CoA carboxylase biotin carboxyl carrier protein